MNIHQGLRQYERSLQKEVVGNGYIRLMRRKVGWQERQCLVYCTTVLFVPFLIQKNLRLSLFRTKDNTVLSLFRTNGPNQRTYRDKRSFLYIYFGFLKKMGLQQIIFQGIKGKKCPTWRLRSDVHFKSAQFISQPFNLIDF